jgi:hypothetical protein
MNEIDDRLLKRFTAIKKMEYFIEESVYYRTHSEEMIKDNKMILWNSKQESGKILLYENRS